MKNARQILVTGAAGFIGSHLVKKLVSYGQKVAALAREDTDLRRLEEVRQKITIVRADITSGKELAEKVREINPSGIFHLAASNVKSGVTAPSEEVVKTNLLGTVNLYEAAREIDYDFFVQTGSFLEYGMQKRPLKETDPADPGEIYSITKLAATLYATKYAKADKKPLIVFRVFTPYGPEIHKGRLIRDAASLALAGKDINLTQPSVSRDFIYVDDLVDLLIEGAEKALNYQGEIFNAGSGASTTLEEIARLVLKITGSKSKVSWGKPPVSYDTAPWQADMKKTFSAFSWQPKHEIEDGLKLTAEWIKSIKSR